MMSEEKAVIWLNKTREQKRSCEDFKHTPMTLHLLKERILVLEKILEVR